MDRVAELEREVTELRTRCTVMQHVAEDMSEFVGGNNEMIALVVDDVLAFWRTVAPDQPDARGVWHQYANRIEYADPDLGILRPDICSIKQLGDPTAALFDTNAYLEACWQEHVEILQLNAMMQAA